jgi:transcriptional regulator with XRE-family HTH domain
MAEHEKTQVKSNPPKTIEDGIGNRLKAAREVKGLSQIDLHNKTGLSRTVLINYEAGRHKPGVRELRLLCDALEVSPNQLIYGTEEPDYQAGRLTNEILAMGDAGVGIVLMLSPMIGAMLGQDDTRSVLNLIESLLKAKSPKQYEGLMEIVKVIKEEIKKGGDPASIMADPNKIAAYQQGLEQRLTETAGKIMQNFS